MFTSKKYVYALLSVLFTGLTSAQSKTDSLLKALTKKGDTSEIKTLNLLAWELCKGGDHEKAIYYSGQALKLAGKAGFNKGKAGAFNNLGNIYFGKADYPEALKYYLEALKTSEAAGDKKMIVSCTNNLGIVYEKQNDFDRALRYHFSSLKIKEQLGDKKGIANSYTNIGNVYNRKGSYNNALEYYNKSMVIALELGKKNLVISNLNNIGYIRLNTQQYGEAEVALQKALKLSEETGDVLNTLMALINLSDVFRKQGHEVSGNTKQQKFQKALELLKKTISISTNNGARFYTKDAYKELALLYNEMHKPKEALVNFKQFVLYRDSIFNEENTKQSLTAEMNYEFEKKEAVANAEREKKEAIAVAERERERQKNKIIFTAVLSGLIVVGGFAAFVARANNQKRKANRLLAQQKKQIEVQKEIVESKQKEILDSIHYARRIQTALLPTERYVHRQLQKRSYKR